MAKDQDDLFEVRVGKPRADRGRGATPRALRSFEGQIMHAVAKAGGDPRRIGKGCRSAAKGKARNGRFNARGRGAKVIRTLPRDTGWSFNKATGMRMRMRRVVVKARFVKLKGPRSRAGYRANATSSSSSMRKWTSNASPGWIGT